MGKSKNGPISITPNDQIWSCVILVPATLSSLVLPSLVIRKGMFPLGDTARVP